MFKQFCSVLTLGLVVGCSSPNDPDDDPQSGGGPAATGGAAGEVGTGAMGGAGASGSVGAVGGASEATGGASEATGGASEATGGASEATGGAGLDPCGGDSETNFDGYWRRTTPGDYEDYLRIENDGGYSCSSDGKSGYSFQIEGNVVTPLGLSSVDTIEATSPDTLRLSGEEKGVLYEVDYVKTSQANYPQFCIDQEADVPPDFDGYWRRTTPGDYEDYLRIENGGGYSCSSDGKSGYSFQIEGNVVTPLGLSSVDTIEATSPDTLRLSGEEKGVLYEVDYVKTSQANYPQFCIDQEAEFSEP